MSNPIADTAEYFADKERTKNTKPNLRIFPSQEQQASPGRLNVQDLLSPESPLSRRPQASHHSISDFDPKAQWQKVLKKLPNVGGKSDNDDDDDGGNSSSSSDGDQGAGRLNVYEMSRFKRPYRRHKRKQQQQQQVSSEQDDLLPDTNDIDKEGEYNVDPPASEEQVAKEDNYFADPFSSGSSGDVSNKSTAETQVTPTALDAVLGAKQQKKAKKKQKQKQDPSSSSSSSSNNSSSNSNGSSNLDNSPTTATSQTAATPTSPDGGKAKKHWGKTLDKVRLIANMQTLPQQSKTAVGSTSSLAPYYPPLFDPVFIALSKDQHGHPWPPVLLPFLKVAITDSELLTQGINQWVFRIELQYGDIKWVIRRTIADFVGLHYTLKFKSSLSDAVPSPPSFPSQLESWLNSAKGTIVTDHETFEGEKHMVALKRRKALTGYLRQLLIRAHMKANYDICEFLEISAVSIVEDMGWKGKEGFLENKVNFVIPRLCHIIKPHFWNKQWVILRDSYVAFISEVASTRINDVFLFDKSLVVQNKKPGLLGKYHNHITLENQFRRIEIKGGRREIEEWMASIERVLSDSPWVKNHRFGSFAPIRHNSKVRWFVDGEDHFNAVGEAILSAKSEIYIADWWLSPELYLRRPPEKNQEFRLDRLLKRKAEEGVKIYIVIYKEMAVALTINSAHTKLWLQGLHKNIIVVRHPDHRSIDNNVLFWSHHESTLSRYDSQSHRLTDYPAEGHTDEVFPGQDYSNPRVKDFLNGKQRGYCVVNTEDCLTDRVQNTVVQYDTTLVDRSVTPRMPWHDMTVGMVGPAARDVARHFIQRWNFLKASKGMHRPTVPFLMPKGEYVAVRDETAFKGTCRVQMLRSSAQWSSGIKREHSIYNAYMECISKSKHFIYIENQFFISSTTQDKLLRNKIAQALVERIKRAHAEGEKFKVFIIMPLIPAFEGDLATKDAAAARNVMHFQYLTISRGGNSIMEKLREAGIEPSDYIGWYSLRNWDKLVPPESHSTPVSSPKSNESRRTSASAGSSRKAPSPRDIPAPSEKSIWDDDDREHYVSELVYIHDKIMIVDDRIVLIGSANINDRSQLGNRDSEIAMLIEDTDMIPSFMDGKEYKAAKFAHSLRMQLFKEHLGLLDFTSWDQLIKGEATLAPNVNADEPIETHHTNEHATEEEIRDYEAAGPNRVLEHKKRSGAAPIDSADFGTMAVRVDAKALDPLASHCYQDLWNATAENNTLVYRELFRCVPDDTVHTFEQHRKFLPDPAKIPHGHVADPELHGREIRQRLGKVRGHLVQFPCDYLKDENMLGSLIRETVTPMVIFT
ncbi:hypothetical protein [Parasitella parasitica]|uniref:Phospholipase n=1 Tax=Parasitella parasitica TaxID=35722 RepID=A0A0B7N5N5_9FUNG|nr:hypothetical protein [Parasitella parasitica]